MFGGNAADGIEDVKAVPLERLAKDFKGMKAEISTPTLANWVIEASQLYLKPVYQALKEKLLNEKVIHADETASIRGRYQWH